MGRSSRPALSIVTVLLFNDFRRFERLVIELRTESPRGFGEGIVRPAYFYLL
jgi:hypothetical protein